MKNQLENISIYLCSKCERHFGIFYAWHEVEDESEPVCCPSCGGNKESIEFLADVSEYPKRLGNTQ